MEIFTDCKQKLEKYMPDTAEFEETVERFLDSDAEDVLWFGLKKGDISFKIGLSEILRCLKFAEKHGEVPELPRMWWIEILSHYPQLRSD